MGMSAFFSNRMRPVFMSMRMAARTPLEAKAGCMLKSSTASIRASDVRHGRTASLRKACRVAEKTSGKLVFTMPVIAVTFFDGLQGKSQQHWAEDNAHGTKTGHAAEYGKDQHKEGRIDALAQE